VDPYDNAYRFNANWQSPRRARIKGPFICPSTDSLNFMGTIRIDGSAL